MTKKAIQRLKARYLPVDYVAELQKYWAYLNGFYNDAVIPSSLKVSLEQKKLEPFKQYPKVKTWAGKYQTELVAFNPVEKTAIDAYGQNGIPGIFQCHMLGNHRNPLTDFVLAFDACRNVNSSINDGYQKYVNSSALPSPALVHLGYQQYRHLYSASIEAYDLANDFTSTDKVLLARGLKYLGTVVCSAGAVPSTRAPAPILDAWSEIERKPALNELMSVSNMRRKADLHEDLIQHIYVVRNAAMHGAKDWQEKIDNEITRTALVLIRDLNEDIT